MKKSLFKRILCLVMSLVMICGMVVTTNATEVMPIYERIYSTECALTISGTGEANPYVRVSSNENDTLRGTVELKRITANGEQTVATWNVSGTRRLAEQYTHYVGSGYTYKVYASINVFSTGGVYYETVYLESDEVYYG